ncbi:hypothetical protein [Mycobacterium lepromatosis]|uniref:hypothetical protein n=1 Tax=Mycobacterium lepromatosis TaxID=480418 RepID=UPI0012E01B36|nr:hypothetical protein [Mycobacterium lepromatosis]
MRYERVLAALPARDGLIDVRGDDLRLGRVATSPDRCTRAGTGVQVMASEAGVSPGDDR